MASLDADRFAVQPQAMTTAGRQGEVTRTQNMLVSSVVASMIIIVVAALFMTMF